MKLTAYAGLSAALAVSVVTHAVVTRKQFYPAVIYLATSKFSILVRKNSVLWCPELLTVLLDRSSGT